MSCTSSGPNARAGFIAAPVNGPPMKMPSVIVKPIASPAIALKAPRGSAAVAKIDPDEEEGEYGLDHDPLAGADPAVRARGAEVDASTRRPRKHAT